MLNGTVFSFVIKVWSNTNMFYIQISNLNTLIHLLFVWNNSDIM